VKVRRAVDGSEGATGLFGAVTEVGAPTLAMPGSHRSSRAVGFPLPSCRVVSPEGVPLDLLGGTTWVRPPVPKGRHRTHTQRPLADKDSRRGLDLMDAATADVLLATRVILVADREADIFDGLGHATEPGGTSWCGLPGTGGLRSRRGIGRPRWPSTRSSTR